MTSSGNNRNKPASSAEITSLTNFYSEMTNNLKDMVKSTTVLDDKIKALVSTQDDLTNQIDKLVDTYQDILSRIINMEAKDLDAILSTINTTGNRLAVLEHEIEIIDDLHEMVNNHANTLAVICNDNRDLKEKVKELTQSLNDMTIKIERLNFHKGKTEKIFDYIVNTVISIVVAYIIYALGLAK